MAIILCPECGEKVSDKAKSCPHCGCPIGAGQTAPPPLSSVKPLPEGPEVGLYTHSFKCPGCGTRLESKHIMSSGWAKCPTCKRDVQLGGINSTFSDGIVEKIFPFGCDVTTFHRKCMQHMMNVGAEDFFRNVTDISTKRNYIWVREFGAGQKRDIFPMCSYGVEFFKNVNGSTVVPNDKYESTWPTQGMKEFSSEHIKDATLHPKEISSKECKYKYSTAPDSAGLAATDNYYCLPIYEEEFTYDGQKYRILGSGDSDISVFHPIDVPEDKEIILGSPNFTKITPVTVLASIILAIIAIMIVWSIFSSSGFWLGLLITAVIVVICSFLSFLFIPIFGIFMGIDVIIQKAINSARRKSFRNKYEEIQKSKQRDAKDCLNLNLDYEVPEVPIP